MRSFRCRSDVSNCNRHVYRKNNITAYRMDDGRVSPLGRSLANLAAGNGHPAEIMDMSFGIQALCIEHLATKGEAYTRNLSAPEEIDRYRQCKA